MKKLLLKINLLNFILTIPTLVFFNNYNLISSEHYMKRHMEDKEHKIAKKRSLEVLKMNDIIGTNKE